ncbi:hypothetical protein D7X87_26305, partial [bacterium D16-54]
MKTEYRHTLKQEIKKRFPVFLRPFLAFSKIVGIMPCKGIERNSLSRLANSQTVRGGCAKRNFHKFLQITVIFAFCGFVGSRGRNIAVALAKSPLAALKVLREAHTEEAATFLELYRKVSYPDICKTPSKHKPIE